MEYTLSYQGLKENMAFAVGKNLSISMKQSVEICSACRGKSTAAAKRFLAQVIIKKKAVPMKRFNRDTGHKPGIAAGRYPVTAAKMIMSLIESAESNERAKGLGSDLYIVYMVAHKASSPWHFGRLRRRKMKRTHVEVVLAEQEKVKND